MRLEWIIHLDRFNDATEERENVSIQGDWYWRTLLKKLLVGAERYHSIKAQAHLGDFSNKPMLASRLRHA